EVLVIQDVIDPGKVRVHRISGRTGSYSWKLAACTQVIIAKEIRREVLDACTHIDEIGFLPGYPQQPGEGVDIVEGLIIGKVVLQRPKAFLPHAFGGGPVLGDGKCSGAGLVVFLGKDIDPKYRPHL